MLREFESLDFKQNILVPIMAADNIHHDRC